MPFRSSLADIELKPSVFHSRTPPCGRAVRPSERPSTRITARDDDENRLEIKFPREARESSLSGSPPIDQYAEPDDSFHPHALQRPGIFHRAEASTSIADWPRTEAGASRVPRSGRRDVGIGPFR